MADHYLSTLIVGATEADRATKLDELSADVRFQLTTFDCREKKGIADVRTLIKSLVFKPSIEKRAVIVIIEMQLLSPESQTTLLKLVEEPPEGFAIYISADRQSSLLPTIVSRCRVISLGKREFDEGKIEDFLTQPLSFQFGHLNEIEIDELLYVLDQKLLRAPDPAPVAALVEKAFAVKKKLSQAPINAKLVKEFLLLEYSFLP